MKKFLIKVNGNQYEVEVEEIRDVNGEIRNVNTVNTVSAVNTVNNANTVNNNKAPDIQATTPQAPDSKTALNKQETKVSACATVITAPMPGTILKVNVNVGDEVKRGQVLLILEAMKMENEIVTPADGKVVSINVSKGATVNAGDVLIYID